MVNVWEPNIVKQVLGGYHLPPTPTTWKEPLIMRDGEPKAPYCGNPAIDMGNLFRSDQSGGVLKLFENRRVAFSFNARVAIRQACDLLDLRSGDEVLVPAYNCGTEIDPLLDANLTVRMYPIGDDLRVMPDEISKRIMPATKAVYITHYFGIQQEKLSEIRSLCDTHGLRLIEDCALSLLSGDAPVDGRTGDISIFCFYKFFPVIGGGALVVNAPDLADPVPFQARAPARFIHRPIIRSFVTSAIGVDGMVSIARAIKTQLRAPKSPASGGSGESDPMTDIPADYYFDAGLRNTRMNRLTHRMLGAFDITETMETRRTNWALYAKLLKNASDVGQMQEPLVEGVCPLGYPVTVSARDVIVAHLQELGISATPWWAGFHKKLDWRGYDSAIRLKNTTILLPLHTGMGARHICYIAEQLQVKIKSG